VFKLVENWTPKFLYSNNIGLNLNITMEEIESNYDMEFSNGLTLPKMWDLARDEEVSFLNFIVEFGLIASSRDCPACNCCMNLTSDAKGRVGRSGDVQTEKSVIKICPFSQNLSSQN